MVSTLLLGESGGLLSYEPTPRESLIVSNLIELRRLPLDNPDDSRPKYQLICDHFYAEIRAGRLEAGQSLPPEAKLSEMLGVSRNTLRQALGKLEDDGMLERVRGRGTFLTSEQQRHSRKHNSTFALLSPQIREGSYPSLIDGFERACAGFQHQSVVRNSHNDIGQQADILMQFMQQSIGGVAVVPTTMRPTPAYQLQLLQEQHIPVVCCHRTVDGLTAPSVVFSGHEIGWQAAQALLKRGHRRIAFLYAHRYSMVDERESGFRSAIADLVGPHGARLDMMSYDDGADVAKVEAQVAIRAALSRIVAQSERATAIFCMDANAAAQVYLLSSELGLRVPQDLSLLYFGSTWRESPLSQRISSVCVNEREMGACSANLLHEMRTGKRALNNNEQVVFSTSLIEGETLGSPA